MSIEAVSWALSQHGLKPTTKLVLVFLANCHNTHTRRCDPSQNRMASACEVSRSTINLHLKTLEHLGFIQRIRRSDKRTKRQKSTYYILGFDGFGAQHVDRAMSDCPDTENGRAESEKTAKPSPKNSQSRVRPLGHKPERNLKRKTRARRSDDFGEISQQVQNVPRWREKIQAIRSGKRFLCSDVSRWEGLLFAREGLVSVAQLRKLDLATLLECKELGIEV